jgi:hypothetical protein
MKLYCIYDRKGELMNPPFVQQNNAMAIRQFQIMVNQPSTSERSNIIHDYHEDFVLMYLGEFDDNTHTFYYMRIPPRMLRDLRFLSRGMA